MHLILLGTGTPVPDPARAGSGIAFVKESRWILVDCGRGITQRVLEAGLDLTSLDAVFLTHHHSDHVSDLPTLAITRWVAGATSPLRVLAPEGPCTDYSRRCLDAFDDQCFFGQAGADAGTRPAVATETFTPTHQAVTVFTGAGWSVAAVLVDHPPITAAVGYRVTMGTTKIAFSGDTAVGPGMRLLAEGADYLIHEAVRSDIGDQHLLSWNASAGSVGTLAEQASVGTVILTHLLPRPQSVEDEQRFIDETRAGGFRGEAIVAHDGLTVPIRP